MSNPQIPTPPEPALDQSFVDRNGISPIVFAVVCLGVIFLMYFVGSVGVMLIAGSSVTRDNVFLHRLLTLAGHLLFFLLPVLFCARLLTGKMSELFPWRIPSFRETFFGLIGLFWLQQIFQIYLFFQDRIPLPDELRQLIEPIKQTIETTLKEMVRAESLPELVFVVLVVAIVPAIVEEMLFRGFVQGSFQRRLEPLRAAIFAGVVFGLFHLNPFAIIPLIGLGCYFGFLRLRSNSIVIAMTAHFLNNTLAVLAVYFGMDDDAILGSATGIEPTTGAVLAQLVIYLLLFFVSFTAYLRVTQADQPS